MATILRRAVGVSADQIGSHMRARAHTKPISSSLKHFDHDSRETVDIGWLLHWAFARELVHKAGMRNFAPITTGHDSIARLGAVVDHSMNLGFDAPHDAYTVAAAVAACGAEALVVRYALMGVDACPEWTPNPVVRSHPAGRFEVADPVLKSNRGKPVMLIGYAFVWRGDVPEIVSARREVYQIWAEALHKIHADLCKPGMLGRFQLSAEVPEIEPWKR